MADPRDRLAGPASPPGHEVVGLRLLLRLSQCSVFNPLPLVEIAKYRKQASALSRRLPANVEKADLIQAGLIGVAQAAMNFQWEGDPDSEEGREAFLRYAQMRVKGAMLDELRQMDQLSRSQRRKYKVIQIARERWMQGHDQAPSLAELAEVSGIEVEEIAELEQAASTAQTQSLSDDDDDGDHLAPQGQAATPSDEVEARVDTAILLRRLEKFFATLPERERQVIDAYLERRGLSLTPEEWRFYEVFGLFRFAVIAQQIWYRYFHGQTTNEAYAAFGPAVAGFEARCRRILDGTGAAG